MGFWDMISDLLGNNKNRNEIIRLQAENQNLARQLNEKFDDDD